MKNKNVSPIAGLSNDAFNAIREQIIEYIKMYHQDGEPIGAYKIMKLFEPLISASETQLIELMRLAWKDAASCYRMYPNQKHTFVNFLDRQGKDAIGALTKHTNLPDFTCICKTEDERFMCSKNCESKPQIIRSKDF